MRFPPGFSLDEKDAEGRAKITSKAVIYEVTLLDYTERMDMEANMMLYKQTLTKANKREFELPNQDLDEIMANMKVWQVKDDQSEEVLLQWDKHEATMMQVESLAFAKAIGSMKRLEKTKFQVNRMYWLDEEDFGDENLSKFLKDTAWDKNKDLHVEVELLKLIKVEDWYNDKTAIMKTLRKGKGRSPYADSDIWLRMKIEVNGQEIYSNYPTDNDKPVEE